MPRNISFALTTQQFKARTKTVTRRMGWLHAEAGQELCGVEKSQGLKPGEKIVRLGLIVLVNVRREQLRLLIDDEDYGLEEVAKEGFAAKLTPQQFVEFFCASHKGCTPDSQITRLEYAYR